MAPTLVLEEIHTKHGILELIYLAPESKVSRENVLEKNWE